MKLIRRTFATALVAASFTSATPDSLAASEPSAPLAPPVSDAALAASSGNALGAHLYQQLSKIEPDESLFISPYSIGAALSMVYPGTAKNTAEELRHALGTPASPEKLAASHAVLAAALSSRASNAKANANLGKDDRPFSLKVANALWGDRGVIFQPAFLTTLDRELRAPLQSFDMQKPTESAAAVNRWADENTSHRISNVVSPADMTGVAAVLANAVYFSATWNEKFDKGLTKTARFTSTAGNVADVPMMHATRKMMVGKIAGADVVDLSYKGNELAFLMVVPQSLRAFEATMTDRTFVDARAALATCDVNLAMPKIKMSKGYGLVESLRGLGVRDLFDAEKADLSAMDTQQGAVRLSHVSKVIHKTFVEVDESGTEAAAVTAVLGAAATTSIERPCTAKVEANKPFLFAIYDRPTGAILFLGRMAKA